MTPVCNLDQLEAHLARWVNDSDDDLPIGYILSLEGADSMVTLQHLSQLTKEMRLFYQQTKVEL